MTQQHYITSRMSMACASSADYGQSDWADMMKLEAEGAAAAVLKEPRESCPYDRATQSRGWNHWVYGHDIASHEIKAVENGFISVMSTAENSTPSKMSLRQAIECGIWSPRFVGQDMLRERHLGGRK